MKHSAPDFARQYQAALRLHLDQGARRDPMVIEQIGAQIRAADISILDFAKLHELILVMELLPNCPDNKRAALIRNAGNFFATVVATGKKGEPNPAGLKKTIESLSARTVELAATNRQLGIEIIQRKKVENALR